MYRNGFKYGVMLGINSLVFVGVSSRWILKNHSGGGGEAMYFGDNVFQFNNILEMGPKQIWGDRCSQMFGWVSESKSTINEQSICLGEVNLFLTLSQTQKPERI